MIDIKPRSNARLIGNHATGETHMLKAVIASLIVAIAIVGYSIVAKAESAGTYRDAVSQCGKEWRNSDARKSVEKGKGREAWQAFRKDCVARVGYVTKKGKRS